ncbi:MAG: HD domain-containing protein [Candidatus Shapirobacteria bacterium]
MYLPQKIIDLMRTFKDSEIYVVGGAVRDLLLNREVKDWDLTTNLVPEEILKLFPKNSYYNNLFGTVGIIGKDGEIFEVTTYRSEEGYADNRHPDKVIWGETLEEDVKRRDFTINALAMDVTGKIYDFWDGENDLKNGLIRTVGNPDERFGEDALRMMRAVRISAQLKFQIEEKTFESIVKNAKLINNIAYERIAKELFLILQCAHPGDGMIVLKNSGILAEIMPEMLAGVGMVQRGHHIYDVWKHSLEALNNCSSSNPITRLAALLHDVGKPVVMKKIGDNNTFHNHEVVGSRIALAIGKRFKLSKEDLQQLFILTRWHMFTVSEMQTDSAVRRFIKKVTVPYLDEMIALRRGDRLGSGAKETSWRWELFKKRLIEVQTQPFSVKDLKVDGKDVMEILKIKPSRKVGEVLDDLFAQVELDPKLNEREILLKKISDIL